MAKSTKKRIEYLISYDLAAKDGEKRDYEGLKKALVRMGAKHYMKSQWVYECDEGTSAQDVVKQVVSHVNVERASQVVEKSGSVEKTPPILKFKDDKLLVSPFFPRKSGRIYLVMGRGKEEAL